MSSVSEKCAAAQPAARSWSPAMTASASSGCWCRARCRTSAVYGSASKPRLTSRRILALRSTRRALCVARAIAWCSAWSASREASRSAARGVVVDRRADRGDVGVVPALGGGPRDQLLDQRAEVEDLGELGPGRNQRPADHLVGIGSPVGLDERPAAAAALGGHVPGRLQPLQRLPHAGPADLEHGGQLALGGQPLPGHELAERDRGDDPLGDPLARGPHRDRGQQRAEPWSLDGFAGVLGHRPGSPRAGRRWRRTRR